MADPISSLISGLINGGGLIANMANDNANYNKAVDYAGKGAAGYNAIDPKVGYQSVGDMGPSAYNTADQTGNTALRGALAQLQQKYQNGGLTAGDMAQVSQRTAGSGRTGG
jgi:aspartate ammonia-lyase